MLLFFQKSLILLCALVFSFSSFSQDGFGFDKLEHDFGEIVTGNDRVVDLKFKNTSAKKVFLLRVDHDREIKTLISTKKIMPDSSLVIRFKYNPTKTGKFKIKIPIYMSNSFKPFYFTLKGNVKEIDNSMGLDCPCFGCGTPKQNVTFEFTATVLDKKTHEPIKNASITFINRGVVSLVKKTNRKGVVKETIPIGLYYFVIDAEEYIGTEFPKYINILNDSILVYLDKPELIVTNEEPEIMEEEDEPIVVIINREPKDTLVSKKEEPVVIEVKKDTIPLIVKIEKDTIIEILKKEEPIVAVIDTAVSEEKLKDFSTLKYKPNNLVFLLDISSSMRKEGKLDLLKASMIEMVSVLRDVDKITIITYSTFSKVVLKTTTGNNKNEIIETIRNIKAQGMTAGGSGMKLAYRHAKKNYIGDGNNQIIMATDGNFNRGNTKLDRLVTKNRKKGILISVMGIKNKPEHALDMKEISSLGGGTYLFIDNYQVSKEILIQEIKRNSGYLSK